MSAAPDQLPDQVPLPNQPRKAACLAMLVFAMVMTLAAFAEVGLARDGRIPAGLLGYGGGLAVLAGAAYYVQVRFAPYADPLLLPLAVGLNGLGLAMIYRLDLSTSKDVQDAVKNGKTVVTSGLASAGTQLQWTFVGILLFALTVLFLKDSKILQRYMYTLGACAIILLLLPIVPGLGAEINGARVWIFIGPFSVQPGEFAKLLLVVFFAGYLVNKRQAMSLIGKKIGPLALPRGRDLGPIMVIWVFGLGVLFIQKDLGTALLYFGLFVSMIYIATQRSSWVLIGVGMLALGILVATQLPFLSHVNQRLSIWQSPEPYFDGGCLLDSGKIVSVAPGTQPYIDAGNTIGSGLTACAKMGGKFADSAQLMKGLFSLGEGGVLGKGLGQGEPWRTPLAFSDFIFDSMGEELGLTGLMVILLLYALIVQRGMKTAVAARDPFLKLFAGGVSFVLALQVFVIVGGVTRLIPLTGLTTPFLAQGGSSLMANWILIGVLVRMSHQARQPAPQAIQDEGMTQVVSLR
jgi:cell division protein FtsW (lipid II flippase)